MTTAILSSRTLEMKQRYRKNLSIGFGLSSFLHLGTVGIVLILLSLYGKTPDTAPHILIDSRIKMISPPNIAPPTPDAFKVKTDQRELPVAVTQIVAVPDDEAPEDATIASQNDLQLMAAEPIVDNLDDVAVTVDVDKVLDDILPPQGTFVPYEVQPEKVVDVLPDYPPLAQRAGIEGVVWVEALIDKEGKVRDVRIAIPSGANAGFEEAAIEAAYKTVWKPAIANGQPIAVWTTYRIKFRLRN